VGQPDKQLDAPGSTPLAMLKITGLVGQSRQIGELGGGRSLKTVSFDLLAGFAMIGAPSAAAGHSAIYRFF
jgi:hypothetical protein